MTIASSFREYLLGLGRSPKTIAAYEREVGLALAWCFEENLELRELTASQLAAYANLRPNTPSVRAHLRSALRYWWEWQGVPGWPHAIRVPTPAGMVCKALTPDEARAIVKSGMGWWRAGTATLVGIYLGLRNEEIASMRWDGFDPNREWYTLVGKGNRERTIPVHPVVAGELDGHRAGGVFVFEGRRGGVGVTHATIWNWVREVADYAGVDGMYPHRLRHTALATANDNTGDLRAVQSFAGHAKIETTAGYTRATRDKLRAVSASLEYLD